jgi:large subunit ribosomal protein L29
MATNSLTAQLRVSTEEELHAKLAEAKEELFNLRFQGATGQLESHGRLRAVRKEIARIYTVMRERELGIITLIEDGGEPEDSGSEAPVAVAAGSATADDVTEEAGK